MFSLSFFVPGTPISQGSKSLRYLPNGKCTMYESSGPRLKKWRTAIYAAAYNAMRGKEIVDAPVACEFVFYLPRPKTVKRQYPKAKPDLSKLVRAAEDALTGVVYTDDARIVRIVTDKRYADGTIEPGVQVFVTEYPESP